MAEQVKRKYSVGTFILGAIATAILPPLLVLLLAWNGRWIEGWIFGLWFSAMVVFNSTYMYLKDPALLSERTKMPGSDNQKGWDKFVESGALIMLLVWLIVIPLDAGRFHWSPAFPLWLKIIGGLMLIPAIYLIERTTMENTFLSTAVRIQSERKQHVISTGVYGFVRHPLYLGCVLMMFGAPLLTGSIYGLAIAAVGGFGLIGRILGEEKVLVNELEGYAEYRQKVRSRLIPLIW
jgi:protein-S-isoprenylcysteine O-methyltransferase Ste14